MPEPTTVYDAYAAVYDAVGQGEFGAAMAARTLGWAVAGQEAPQRVLDLACGTGAAALTFAAAGHHVVGVDASAAMLRRAAVNARARGLQIEWLQADLRALPVDEPSSLILHPSSFDLATCFFDSLNYLTGDGDLLAAFGGVSRLLRPGGSFVFDMNTEAEFATWDERDEVTHDAPDLLVYNRLRYRPETRLASGKVVWFTRRDDLWRRAEELHVERAWSHREVREALEASGMHLFASLSPEGAPVNEETPRVVYYARR